MSPILAASAASIHPGRFHASRVRRAALVPLLVATIAVGALAIATPAGTAIPDPAKGVHHVEKTTIPVELGPATVVVP